MLELRTIEIKDKTGRVIYTHQTHSIKLLEDTLWLMLMNKIDIRCAILKGLNLNDNDSVSNDLKRYNFSYCDLSNSKFQNLDLSEINFSNACLTNSTFINCKLTKSNLFGCDLYGCTFSGCDLSGSIIHKTTNIQSVTIDDSMIKNTKITCNFMNTKITNSNLS